MPRLNAGSAIRFASRSTASAVDGEAEPRMLLTDFLRHELGATGTHVGCEHGVCGACTIEIDGVAGTRLPDARRAGGRRRDSHRRGRSRRRRAGFRCCRRRSAGITRCNAASAPPAS